MKQNKFDNERQCMIAHRNALKRPHAMVVNSFDSTKWFAKCKYCDQELLLNSGSAYHLCKMDNIYHSINLCAHYFRCRT